LHFIAHILYMMREVATFKFCE